MTPTLLSFASVTTMGARPCLESAIHGMLKNSPHLSYYVTRRKKDEFNFGHNEKPDPQIGFDFEKPVTREPAEEPDDQSGRDGANPILPLQPSKLIRAVNACDPEHNEERVPAHEYSSVCVCAACTANRSAAPTQLFDHLPLEEIKYGTYTAKQLRFDRITETEARSFIVPRNYLRRWFVGATLCFGAFSPERYLVAASVLSSPAAHSKRFTSRNSKEIRRFVMLDCCGRNSESRFLSWILREVKKLCPHLRFIFTFGNPKYDKETPYRAAGFRFDGTVDCSAQWISHGTHKAREAKEDKHRYVYTYQ